MVFAAFLTQKLWAWCVALCFTCKFPVPLVAASHGGGGHTVGAVAGGHCSYIILKQFVCSYNPVIFNGLARLLSELCSFQSSVVNEIFLSHTF